MNSIATTFELLNLLDTLVRQVAYMRHLQTIPAKQRKAGHHDAVRMAVAEVDALVMLHQAHAVGAELQTPPPDVTDIPPSRHPSLARIGQPTRS